MACAMRLVRIEPDAPTMMPPTISAVLWSAIPAAAADRPVNAFKSEITTGMSAPPIGSTIRFPSAAAATSSRIIRSSLSDPATIATAHATATASSARFTNCCARPIVIGLPGRISWSFPNAMFEPQNEIEPMIAENRLKIATYVASPE